MSLYRGSIAFLILLEMGVRHVMNLVLVLVGSRPPDTISDFAG